MNTLLSLTDALEDFDACEYALSTAVDLRIGARTSAWRLLLSPPMFPGADDKRAIFVQFVRQVPGADADPNMVPTQRASDEAGPVEAHGRSGEITRLNDVRAPDLLRIAEAYGIDPEAPLWELTWSVPPHAMTRARGRDPRWPNTPATSSTAVTRAG